MSDERAAEGIEHLQRAAMEMISATRAFLDVAEEVVSDPERLTQIAATVGSVADVVVRSARDAVGADRSEAEPTDPYEGRVQHIRVS